MELRIQQFSQLVCLKLNVSPGLFDSCPQSQALYLAVLVQPVVHAQCLGCLVSKALKNASKISDSNNQNNLGKDSNKTNQNKNRNIPKKHEDFIQFHPISSVSEIRLCDPHPFALARGFPRSGAGGALRGSGRIAGVQRPRASAVGQRGRWPSGEELTGRQERKGKRYEK